MRTARRRRTARLPTTNPLEPGGGKILAYFLWGGGVAHPASCSWPRCSSSCRRVNYPQLIRLYPQKIRALIHRLIPMQLFIGFLLGLLIASLAWWAGALSGSGAWAAALTGGLIFGLGGLPWAALLLTFFITSSLLSRLFGRRKATLSEKFSKGSQPRLGAGAGKWGIRGAAGDCPRLGARAGLALAGFLRGHGSRQRRHLGHRDRRAQPLPAAPDHHRETWWKGAHRGAFLCWVMAAVLGGSALVGIVAALFSPQGQALAVLAASLFGGLAGATFDSSLGGYSAVDLLPARPARKRPNATPCTPAGQRPNRCAAGVGWITTW